MRRRWVAAAVGALLVMANVGVAEAARDPYRPQQWHLARIGAPAAWSSARGAGQVVAIIDSGIDLHHPDLKDRLLRDDAGAVIGKDFIDGDDVAADRQGHGTMVAGLVAASLDNGIGGAGVAPKAALMPVRVLDENGRGTEADVEAGIRWAVTHGATVINLSLESAVQVICSSGEVCQSAPVAAVQYAWDQGVVVVAAAGNGGSRYTDYPSSSPVVLVGAVDRNNQRAAFSDTGRADLLMAPGIEIVSTWCRKDGDRRCADDTHSYGLASGTSFAAPQVAGAVALLEQLGMQPAEAVDRLRATAQDIGVAGPDLDTGVGLLDVAAAVATTVAAGSATPTPTLPVPASPPMVSPGPAAASPSATPSRSEPVTVPSSTPSVAPTPSTPDRPDVPSGVPAPGEVGPAREPTPVAAGARDAPQPREIWAVVAAVLVASTAAAVGRDLWRQR